MSANGTTDRKRKFTDQNPESLPAPKHIKIGEEGSSSMASIPGPRSGLLPAQTQILQAMLAQQQLSEEQKRKYMTGIEQLRHTVEQNGPTSVEAQAKLDRIFNHLRQVVQRPPQQQQIPTGAAPSGNFTGMSGGGASATAVTASGTSSALNAQRWIPPPNIAPHQADQWRTDISAKLNTLGHKLAAAKAQVQEQQAALDKGGHRPEQEAEIRKRLTEAHKGFTQCKDILSGFYQQQKKLQQAQRTALEQQRQQQQGGQQSGANLNIPTPQSHQPSGGPQQQQRPMQAQQQPQPGMMPAGVHQPQQQPQQQQNITGRPPQHRGMQQQQQQPQQQPVQRVATPVDRTRAGSPPNVNSHVSAMNQVRQQQQQQTSIPPSMSPNQPNLPLQNQQQPPPPQQQQQQQQQQSIGRSPAATNTGTPMTAGPNSPAPRPGSTQPQPGRPQSSAGAPIPGQPQQLSQQQQQQPQQQPQQQQARAPVPPPSSAPHVQRDATHQQIRMPIPPTLSVPQPTPMSIPAARPSLSGGANTPGNQILGTPAIIKQPAFEFDEGGMGLLSKRKLEELVKQIDPEEKLDPDVEESILELVDEFIDTIATTACKMAKLRGSDTLDIKDIQIILERNWNIRIPGYSADEIRTVRKFNPAQGYHHKINALVAQKQLAQTSSKNGE